MPRTHCVRIVAAVVLCLPMLLAIGCQSGIRQQTAATRNDFLNDGPNDVPAGAEFLLENQKQALEEYKLEREKLRAGLEDDTN
jgi:hypothetical protein